MLPDPLRVRLPDLKIFQAEFSHEIEEDKRAKFDLGQILNLTKKDEQAFASLSHSMVDDWQEYKVRSFVNDFTFGSWKSWIMPGVGATSVLALIISVMLSYKLPALSSSLTLLSLANRGHAMPTESLYRPFRLWAEPCLCTTLYARLDVDVRLLLFDMVNVYALAMCVINIGFV